MKIPCLTLRTALSITSIGLLFACNKYQDTTGSNTPGNTIPPEQTVTASVTGRVLDENGLPVQGATVTGGIASTTTDINGVFSFSHIQLSSRFGYIKVVKQGYFTGSRSIITTAGSASFVSIQLLPRVLKGSFSATAGGWVVIQPGDTVTFGGSMVVNAADRSTYTGSVQVYATYLDPTDVNLPKIMPGDLRGIGSDGKETALQSFGMMAVELEGDAGQKLQIATGKKATLSFAIPVRLQATAPASIPLWYFNDSSGRWIQEGDATRQGNSYLGQVAHFSFWNCDAPFPTVLFKAHIKDQHGNPLAYTIVQLTTSDGRNSYGYTDSSGYVQGLIPKGASLLMQVMSPCQSLIGGVNVGPALNDQDLGTVTINVESADITLTGKAVDCSGNPVTNGFANILVEGLNYRAALGTGGSFTLPVHRCSSSLTTFKLTAVDLGASQTATASLTASTGTADFGTVTICNGPVIDQSFNMTVEGKSFNFSSPPDTFSMYVYTGNNSTFITAAASSFYPAVYFHLPVLTGTGTVALDSMYVYDQNRSQVYAQKTSMNCTITAFGAVHGYIQGNFNGMLQSVSSGTQVPATGSFKIRRTQ